MVQRNWVRGKTVEVAGSRGKANEREVGLLPAPLFSASFLLLLPFSPASWDVSLQALLWPIRSSCSVTVKPVLTLLCMLMFWFHHGFLLVVLYTFSPDDPCQGTVSAKDYYSEPQPLPQASVLCIQLPTGSPITMSKTKLIWAERFYSEMWGWSYSF